MKLRQYIEQLKELEMQNGNLEVVYASDAEGNSFDYLGSFGAIGYFDGKNFINECDKEHYNLESYNKVICIN